jgi:hypothetical protein
VSGIKLLVNEPPVFYNTLSDPFYVKIVDVNEFHKMLGQCGSDILGKSIISKSKSDLMNKIFILLTDLKISGIDIEFICCDDSGENKSFYDSCRANGHNIKFEFPGPRTPQHNGRVERKFQSSYRSIRERLNNGGLEDSVITSVWTECEITTVFLSNITSIKAKDKCLYQLIFVSKPKLPTNPSYQQAQESFEKWAYAPPKITYKGSSRIRV